MEGELEKIYKQCIEELKSLGIDCLDEKRYGKIDIKLSKRNNKRYGCCKQEKPDEKYKIITKKGWKRIIKYEKYNLHHIEISPWVMELEEKVIKNTIIHELIHCLPYCNNHGDEFKKYAKYINQELGYDISRVGNKKEDYKNSNVEYNEKELYNYKIVCLKCGKEFYRKRLDKNFTKKYRCIDCKGKFMVIKLDNLHKV